MENIKRDMIYVICKDDKFVGAFSEEYLADMFMELYSDEDLKKDFYILNSSSNYKAPVNKNVFFVKINKDGSEIEVDIKPRDFYNIMLIGHVSYDNLDNMIINVWAKDETEAIQIVDMIRSKAIIHETWGKEHDEPNIIIKDYYE